MQQGARLGLKVRRQWRVRPFPHKLPNRILLELSRQSEASEWGEIAIRDETKRYSAAYRRLTAGFYLNF